MNSDENSQPRVPADEPLTIGSPEPAGRADEPAEDRSLTPPHGDPLSPALLPEDDPQPLCAAGDEELPAASPTSAWPPVDAQPTPAFVVEPLPAEPVPSPAADVPEASAPEPVVELPDDHTLTPPHGDPLPAGPFEGSSSPVVEYGTGPELASTLEVEPEPAATAPTWAASPAWDAPESATSVTFEPAAAELEPEPPLFRDPVALEAAAIAPQPGGLAGYGRPAAEPSSGPRTVPRPDGGPPIWAGGVSRPRTEAPLRRFGSGQADELEAAAAASAVPEPVADDRVESGPNWMLAFICAWTGVTSLNEARVLLDPAGFRPELLHNYGFLGYILLGLGLLFFGLEALRWGRPGRGIGMLFVPSALTLAGVICLVLWNDPGRRI